MHSLSCHVVPYYLSKCFSDINTLLGRRGRDCMVVGHTTTYARDCMIVGHTTTFARDCHSLSRVVVPATLTQHLCQRSFYKILVKFRNSKKNVLKIVLIIVNINKDENKSLISNQFSLKMIFLPFLGELFCGGKN